MKTFQTLNSQGSMLRVRQARIGRVTLTSVQGPPSDLGCTPGGESVRQRLPDEEFEERLLDDYERQESSVPALFSAATWLLFIAVAAHVAGSIYKAGWLFYSHYILAMTAVVVFAIAIGTAAASGMAPKQHRTVGYVVFGLLILQVIGGSILAWSWSKQAGDSKLTEKQMKLGASAPNLRGRCISVGGGSTSRL